MPSIFTRLFGALDHGAVLAQFEGRIGWRVGERHLRRVTLVVRHLGLRPGERFLVALGDLGGEGRARDCAPHP